MLTQQDKGTFSHKREGGGCRNPGGEGGGTKSAILLTRKEKKRKDGELRLLDRRRGRKPDVRDPEGKGRGFFVSEC